MISRIIRKYRESGVVSLILIAMRKLPGVSDVCVYYIYSAPIAALKRPPSGISVTVFQDRQGLGDVCTINDKRPVFESRLDLGHICFVAYRDRHPAAYLWAHGGDCHIEQRYGFRIPLSAEQVYYYDSFTDASYRRMGMLGHMLSELGLHASEEQGKKEVVAIVELTNKVSRQAHARLAFEPRSLHIHLSLLGRKRHWLLRQYKRSNG